MSARGAVKGSIGCLLVCWLSATPGCGTKNYDFDDRAPATGGTAGEAANDASAGKGSGVGGAEGGRVGSAGEFGASGSPTLIGEGGAPDVATGGSAGSAGSGDAAGSGGAAGLAGSGGSGGAQATCPATHQCVAPAPAGWSGPVIFAPKSALPNCPTTYPTLSVSGGTGVTGSTSCQCACTAAPVSSACGQVTLTGYLDGSCTTSSGSSMLASNACFAASGPGTSQRVALDAPTAQCAAGTYSALSAPVLSNPMLACGGAVVNPGSCATASEACLPKPPAAANASVCIYKSGLDDCPTGYSASAKLVHKSWTDTRSCPNSCSCTGSGGVCSANRQKFSVSGCSVASGGPVAFTSGPTPTCFAGDSFSSMQVGAPSVSTAPTCGGGSQPATGDLVGADTVTVCCR